jgi:peptide chain release factor subunit 3
LKQIGYSLKHDVYWVPISGLSGANIKTLADESTCPWFRKKPLLTLLDSLQPLDRLDSSPLRIPVLDKYKEGGRVYILGKVETGVLKTGDSILVNPGNVQVNVLQIQNDDNIITFARPGENVKIVTKVTQVEEDSIGRGSVVSHPNSPCFVSNEIVVQIFILKLLENKNLFTAGYEAVFHTHTAVEEFTVVNLLDKIDPKTGASIQKLPKFVKNKSVVIAHLKLSKSICIEKYDDFQQLGRFTIRDEGKTIAFGKVLATHAPIKRKKNQN